MWVPYGNGRRTRRRPACRLAVLCYNWRQFKERPMLAQAAEYGAVMGAAALQRQWNPKHKGLWRVIDVLGRERPESTHR